MIELSIIFRNCNCIVILKLCYRCMLYRSTYNLPALQLLYKINIIVQFFRSCANESGAVRTHQSMSELKDSRRTKVSHAKMGLSDEQFSGRSSKITCSRVSQTVSLPVIQSHNGATKRILKSNHGFYWVFTRNFLNHNGASKLVWSRIDHALLLNKHFWNLHDQVKGNPELSQVSQTVSLPVIQFHNGAKKTILKSNHDPIVIAQGIFRKTRIFFVFQSQICFKILKNFWFTSNPTMGPQIEFRTRNHDPALIWPSICLNSSWPNLCRSGFKLFLFFQTRFVSKPWRKVLVLDSITIDFFAFRNQIFSSF